MRATELAHVLLRQIVGAGDCVIDATVGNGHDTLFLAELVGATGHVLGFDVQEGALAEAGLRLQRHPQARLIHSGHENLAKYMLSDSQKLSAIMFNLGYLPNTSGEQRKLTTNPKTTLSALQQGLEYLKIRGLITLILYPGHPGGDDEAEVVRNHVKKLPTSFAVSHYTRLNAKRPAPELLAIERISAD